MCNPKKAEQTPSSVVIWAAQVWKSTYEQHLICLWTLRATLILLHDPRVDTLVCTLFSWLIDKKRHVKALITTLALFIWGKRTKKKTHQKEKKHLICQKFLVKALLLYTNGWTNTENKLMLLPEETPRQMKWELLSGGPHSAGLFAALGHFCFSNGYCLENYCTEQMSENQELILFWTGILDLKQQEFRSWFMNNSLARKAKILVLSHYVYCHCFLYAGWHI